ncbi:glycine receptor subunit alpha-4-like [Antedon mediterranea]|uniref:glycine receptor subunit alpha-4-like n=1 Tax=Antedon mediterranea TaxID=105859 RepID=UPI003AF8D043
MTLKGFLFVFVFVPSCVLCRRIRETGEDVETVEVERNIKQENETIETFRRLTNGYDKSIRPNFGTGRPTDVRVDIYVASFDSVRESHMDYSLTLHLRQRWVDTRLRHEGIILPPTSHIIDDIWLPDIIFTNAKEAKFHDITFLNKVVNISENGEVLYITRLSLVLSCAMDFHHFPLDQQKCEMEMESFKYTEDELQYRWVDDEPAEFHGNHMKLPQYDISGIHIGTCNKVLKTGAYSCIVVEYLFSRNIGYYLLQTYIPSILLVVMSWVSFWIEIKSSPARVALGVTTVLTMITATNGVREDLPHVSYVKAIDVWFAVCLIFVIGALLEFAIVHHFSVTKVKKKNQWTNSPTKYDISDNAEIESCIKLTIVDKTFDDNENDGRQRYDHRRKNYHDPVTPPGSPPYDTQANQHGEVSILGSCCHTDKKEDSYLFGKKIDMFCRFAFPLTFMIFNIGYWGYYVRSKEEGMFDV